MVAFVVANPLGIITYLRGAQGESHGSKEAAESRVV
jgi:hypothetical protein